MNLSTASDAELQDMLVAKQPKQTDLSLLSDDELKAQLVPAPTASQEVDEGPNWLQKNLGVAGGVGLGTVGSVAGGVFGGPPGAVIGGIAGGALGDFMGTAYSELVYKETEDLDAYSKAVENAMWSAGLDIATLGILSKVKPLYYAAKHKLGQSAEQTAIEIIEGAYGAGSRESLQATQQILESGGATLLPSQIRTSGLDNFRESVASAGLISRSTMNENLQAVNRVIKEELGVLINRNAQGMDASPSEMGDAFFTLINAGQDALQASYLKSLDEVKAGLGAANTGLYSALGPRVSASSFLKPLDKYIRNKKGVAVDELSPESLKFVEDQLGRLRELPNGTFPVSELITLDRSFTQRVTAKFGPGGAEKNSVVQAELAGVATELREAIYNTMLKVNPEAAESYRVLKTTYGEGVTALFPVINKNYIKSANGGSYVGLGNLAAKATNINQIKALRTSLHTAFKEASKDANANLPFESVKQIDELFKRGFLSSKVSSVLNEKSLASDLKTVAKSLDIPAEAQKYKYMLGTDYPRFKQLMNAVLETTESASGDFGQLMLRSAESGGIRNIAGHLTTLVAGGGAAAAGFVSTGPIVTAGVAALFVPQIFANIVTNAKYANRLLMLTKQKSGATDTVNIAVQLLVSDVINNMVDSEKDEMIKYLSVVAKEQMQEENASE